MTRRFLPLAVAMLALPGPLAALQAPQAGNGSAAGAIEALRIGPGATLHLDGRLDDAHWTAAIPVSDFTQQEPLEGGRPSRLTEVRVAYDADALYIGAKIHDDPDGILAYQKQRDAGLGTDDRFMWILDTFLDGRTGYFFEINAAGLMGDGLITGGGGGGGFGGGGGGGAPAKVTLMVRVPSSATQESPEALRAFGASILYQPPLWPLQQADPFQPQLYPTLK